MHIARIRSYIIYVIAFSLVCSLVSELEMALNAWSWGHSIKSVYSLSELIYHFPGHVVFAILQVIAAVLTIRQLSLRKLFYLSCLFAVISALMFGFERQIMNILGWLPFLFILAGNLLPYIAPVFILALINRKRTAPETTVSDVEKETMLTSAESEVATIDETKSKAKTLYLRYWYIFDVFLIILILLHGTLNDPFGLVWYRYGLNNNMAKLFAMFFVWIFLLVPAALCLLVLILRIIISWPKHIQNKHRLLVLRLIVIIGVGGYLIFPFTLFKQPGCVAFTSGFKKYVENKTSIEEIRTWLGTLSPEECNGKSFELSYDGGISNPEWPDEIDWPESLTCFAPHYINLSLDGTGHPKIRLTWGGSALAHWGLVIGGEGMIIPSPGTLEYRLEICKGAYVWYE